MAHKIISYSPDISALDAGFSIFKQRYYLNTLPSVIQYLTTGVAEGISFSDQRRGGNCMDIAEFFYKMVSGCQKNNIYFGVDTQFEHCFFAVHNSGRLQIYDPVIFSDVTTLNSGELMVTKSLNMIFDPEGMHVKLIPQAKDPITYLLHTPYSEIELIGGNEKNKLLESLCRNQRFTLSREHPTLGHWLLKIELETRSVVIRSDQSNRRYQIELWINMDSVTHPVVQEIATLFDCTAQQILHPISRLAQLTGLIDFSHKTEI